MRMRASIFFLIFFSIMIVILAIALARGILEPGKVLVCTNSVGQETFKSEPILKAIPKQSSRTWWLRGPGGTNGMYHQKPDEYCHEERII